MTTKKLNKKPIKKTTKKKTNKIKAKKPNKKSSKKTKNKTIKIFNKEFTKKRVFITTIITLIIIIFIMVNLGIKIDFLTKDELHIGLSPLQEVIVTDYNTPANLTFEVVNNNFWFCNTQCDFRLYNTASRKVISETKETLKANSKTIKKYLINLNTIGHGQKIYYFEAECNNIKTLVCETNERKTYRSSMITINYELPQYEEFLRIELQKQLKNYEEVIKNGTKIINENLLIINDIKNITKTSLNFNSETNIINKENNNIKKINNLWMKEEYIKISKIFNYTKLNEANLMVNNIIQKRDLIKQDIQNYNKNVDEINNILSNISIINDIYNFYLNTKDDLNILRTIELKNKILSSLILFRESSFEEINQLTNEINRTQETLNDNIKTWNTNKNNFRIQSNKIINKHKLIIDEVYFVLGKNVTRIQNNSCEDIVYINNEYNQINKNAKSLLNTTYILISNKKEFKIVKEAYKQSIINKNYTIILNSEKNKFIINNNLTINNTLNLTKKDYYSVITFNFSYEINNLSEKLCSNITSNIVDGINTEFLPKIFLEHDIPENIKSVLFNDVPAKCCIFGQCSECKVRKNNYPIVFIHGHSFNKNNPVESSLETFSKIQKKMDEDKIAINAGDMNLESMNIDTIWSMMDYPISVKASYYYITYLDLGFYSASTRKTDSIESYSLRLKDLIDEVKAKTGAEKVNIVAHSMGGLVSRNYIKLFGENSVNKLIMIGTPNKGINGAVKTFCSSFGAKQECKDMSEGSIFLKKINDKRYIPSIPVYNFYGIGCKTNGKEGDGIVEANNAKLDYATNYGIKGQCSGTFGSNLHMDMINPNIHPEVYNKIVEILSKQ